MRSAEQDSFCTKQQSSGSSVNEQSNGDDDDKCSDLADELEANVVKQTNTAATMQSCYKVEGQK